MLRRALCLLWLCAALSAEAGSWQGCQPEPRLSVTAQDRLLQLTGLIREELDRHGSAIALLSRAGLNLGLIGERYSHAGLSLRDNPQGAWAVRQLYFSCDEQAPRLFDQGLAGFVLGGGVRSRLSLLLLPATEAQALAQAALDDDRAVALLGASYSANAHAWSQRHQNCNQWLIEMLASAWQGGPLSRQQAQAWLREAGYAPSRVELSPPLYWLSRQLPWLHDDDQPEEDRQAHRYQLSLPSAIEAFVRRQSPQSQRLEFCLDETRLVIHAGWEPLNEACEAQPGDRQTQLSP